VRKGKSDKEIYAMKQIKMNQLNAREKDNALNEVRLLASIDSPNIISYKSAFFE
jgi:NIMA (never in mitosis gene a)-related kinase